MVDHWRRTHNTAPNKTAAVEEWVRARQAAAEELEACLARPELPAVLHPDVRATWASQSRLRALEAE